MTTGATTGDVIRRPMPALLTQGFRPFFLAAVFWSAAALALWIVMLVTGTTMPSRFDPLTWHAPNAVLLQLRDDGVDRDKVFVDARGDRGSTAMSCPHGQVPHR